jgi:RNA polymerase sigma-32 factor
MVWSGIIFAPRTELKQDTKKPQKLKKSRKSSRPSSDSGVASEPETVEDRDEEEDEEEDEPEVLIPEVLGASMADEDDVIDAEFEELEKEEKAEGDAHHRLLKRDPLSAYVRETRRYPILSREEEHELATHYVATGDVAAARRLVESNLRLVVKIAYEYRRAYANLLDLVQEGNMGLMQAVRKYDPTRGVKLSSYAAWWIRAYILKFILNNWRLVKIGTTQAQRKLFFNLKKEKERLAQLGFSAAPALLAENLQVSEKDVVDMERRLAAPEASFDAPIGVGDEGGVRTRYDVVADAQSERPDVRMENEEFQALLSEKLKTFADTLSGREETIFRERWLTETPLTLQELGDRYGISRERARQLEKRMLDRLRVYLEEELGTAVELDALRQD